MHLTLGATVLYREPGTTTPVPAIVVRIYGREVVNLRVLTDSDENPPYRPHVAKSELGDRVDEGCWGWPGKGE